ncbi:hypothetical protein BJV78DRAFT_251870 [Lactifluus subvellereus]|nr:hypothetical protein BJV78DRAFT_251870 [Lactifluus subvellereus]
MHQFAPLLPLYNSILFRSALSNSSHSVSFSHPPIAVYASCSLAHSLRRLCKCFSRASYVSSQYVRGPRFSLIIVISAPHLAPVADCADRAVRFRIRHGMERRREPVSPTSPFPSGAGLPPRYYPTESIRSAELRSDRLTFMTLHACEHFHGSACLMPHSRRMPKDRCTW